MAKPFAVVQAGNKRASLDKGVGPAAVNVPRGPRKRVRCDVVLAYCLDDEEYLPQSAESILNQNYADVVLHLVADGFDPGPYARQIATEPNVRLYRNDESVGPYVSAMRVWDRMETPFFAVQDADDIALPNRIWDAVTTLEKQKGDLFGACCEQFLDRGSRGDESLQRKLEREPFHRSGVVWDTAPRGMCINVTLVVRRRSFERLNGFSDMFCGGDCEFNTRARAAGLKAIVSPHLHGLRRLQSRSLSHGDEYGMGTPGRIQEHARLQSNYPQFTPGFNPRPFGALDQHRRGAGTIAIR